MKLNKFWAPILLLGLTVSLLHVATFKRTQPEGDEMVYLSLSDKISLSMDHYTTKDVTPVNAFPAKLYRSPYFIHPPLFPAILKALSFFGNRAFLGLVFNLLCHFFCCILVLYGTFKFTQDFTYSTLGAFLAAVCPVLTAATIKLHIDALAGLLCMATFLSILWVEKKNRPILWLVPALFFGLALNSKLTLAAVVPGYMIMAFAVIRGVQNRSDRFLSYLISLTVPALMIAPHYAQLLYHYKTLYPASLLVHDLPTTDFLKRILERTRIHALINLITLSPIAVLLFIPSFYRSFIIGLKDIPRQQGWLLIIFLVNLVVPVFVLFYGTERYWALFLPFFYFAASLYLFEKKALDHLWVKCAVLFSFFLMICSSFYQGVITPQNDLVYPSLFMMIPNLLPYYL